MMTDKYLPMRKKFPYCIN